MKVRQQGRVLVYLASLLAVRQVAVPGETAGSEGFAWIWVFWALKNSGKVNHIIRTNALLGFTLYEFV